MNIHHKKAFLFVFLAYVLTFINLFIYVLLGQKQEYAGIALFSNFIPLLCAVILQKYIYKQPVLKPLGISFRLNYFFIIAWLLPVVITFAVLLVSVLIPGMDYGVQTDMFSRLHIPLLHRYPFLWTSVIGLLVGIIPFSILALGEEVGWRGFLFNQLIGDGFWKSSFIIGLVWALWHLPVYFFLFDPPPYVTLITNNPTPNVRFILFIEFLISTMLLSPLLSFIRIKSKSVIASAIFHGTLNMFSLLPLLFLSERSVVMNGLSGLPGIAVFALADLGLFFYYKNKTIS